MGQPGVPLKLSKEDIKNSIIRHGGDLTGVAADFRICRTTIYPYIKRNYPELWEVIDEAREAYDQELVEYSEKHMLKCIKMQYEDCELPRAKLGLDAAKYSLAAKGSRRKWNVIDDDPKKNEGAMVDKMKSMEVVV